MPECISNEPLPLMIHFYSPALWLSKFRSSPSAFFQSEDLTKEVNSNLPAEAEPGLLYPIYEFSNVLGSKASWKSFVEAPRKQVSNTVRRYTFEQKAASK